MTCLCCWSLQRIRLLNIFHGSSQASSGQVGLIGVWNTNHDMILKTFHDEAKWLLIKSRRHLYRWQLSDFDVWFARSNWNLSVCKVWISKSFFCVFSHMINYMSVKWVPSFFINSFFAMPTNFWFHLWPFVWSALRFNAGAVFLFLVLPRLWRIVTLYHINITQASVFSNSS